MPLGISGFAARRRLVRPGPGDEEDPFEGQEAGHALCPYFADTLLGDVVLGREPGDGHPMLSHQAADHRAGQDAVAIHQGRSAIG